VKKLGELNQFSRILNRLKDILFLRPFLPFWVRRLQGKGMIYLYHRIDNELAFPFLNKGGSPWTSPEEFRQDLLTLKSFGAEFVSFSEMCKCDFNGGFKVVICADDGFASCYQQGAQICAEEAVPLTIFQCSAMLKGEPLIWEHQLYFLWFHHEHGYEFRLLAAQHGWPKTHSEVCQQISPEKIIELMSQFLNIYPDVKQQASEIANDLYPDTRDIKNFSEAGGEVGSHGDQHFPRGSISQQEFARELGKSKQKLQEIVGQGDSFSFPFDEYQDGDDELCRPHYKAVANVAGGFVTAGTSLFGVPRNTFPGKAKNKLRHRRWLLTGKI